MTTQRQTVHTSFGRNKRIAGFAILALLLAGCLFVVVKTLMTRYEPPVLEEARKHGVPVVDEGYLYTTLESNFGYSIQLAANLYRQEDGSLNIYLTNPADSGVHILCEITDAETGEMFYRCGRLEPGTYVENLPPLVDFENKMRDIDVKVYAFTNKDFTSAGTTTMRMVLRPW